MNWELIELLPVILLILWAADWITLLGYDEERDEIYVAHSAGQWTFAALSWGFTSLVEGRDSQ